MKTPITIVLIAAIACSLTGQRKAFRGTISDFDKEPIEGVEIYIDMNRIDATTNSKGRYKVKLPNEFELITVYSVNHGFINWKYNDEKKIDFVFPKNSVPLDKQDFLSLGYKAPLFTKEHEKNFYGSYGSILEILDKRFQQVRVYDEKILIGRMGLNTFTADQDPLILVNDVPTNIATVETIPTTEVKSIEVISKGSEAATYGFRAMNGVIKIYLKTAEDES